ncbi:hypothetical protein SAMN04488077_1038 [Roseovarius tolerans]|uniref:Uncharacterized protein n=1 Tax=Roseovarius tolerans TaxID=74031 RepID=A0A1H7WIF6_9RHOB|nr:hypothetical protein SAMN04488077_1038 [Roseovarius tolerans]
MMTDYYHSRGGARQLVPVSLQRKDYMRTGLRFACRPPERKVGVK